MRLLAITIMTFLAMVGTVQATMQEPELITYSGKEMPLEGAPLNYYKWPDDKRPAFMVERSSNWRGYNARWEIQDGKLYLIDIDAMIDVSGREQYENWDEFLKKGEFVRVGVTDLFSKDVKDGKVFASWYSGVLRIGAGERVEGHPMGGFGRFYSREVFLTIDKGVVRNTCIKEQTHDEVRAKLWKSNEEGVPVLLICP